MANITFESWVEAYEYQLKTRTDKDDHLFMLDLDLVTNVEAIDNLMATTGEDVVWLVVDELGKEQYMQYGIGKNRNWYSIYFDGFSKEFEKVGSLKEYQDLKSLIQADSRAISICKNINKLIEVYQFLITGKITPNDRLAFSNPDLIKANFLEFADQQIKLLRHEDDGVSYENEIDSNELNQEISWSESDIKSPEKQLYVITYGDISEKEDETFYDEMTENEAQDKYNEKIQLGYSYVELSQVKQVHINFK